MAKTRAASHSQQAASQDLISRSAMNQNWSEESWSHFVTKRNEWISTTLPQLTKDLVMAYARTAVGEYVSYTQLKSSLPKSLQFEVGKL